MYSQNNEDQIVSDYFGDEKKTVLEIGANDGQTLSNSLFFIEKGWTAHLIEPSRTVFQKLNERHINNDKVHCYLCGISGDSGIKKFYESGQLLGKGDLSLVSSIDAKELGRWGSSVSFVETSAQFLSWNDFLSTYNLNDAEFNYISIDAEGSDWSILQQINLSHHKCEVLCVEWNSLPNLDTLFTQYANQHGLLEINRNAENIIYAKRKSFVMTQSS